MCATVPMCVSQSAAGLFSHHTCLEANWHRALTEDPDPVRLAQRGDEAEDGQAARLQPVGR